VDVSVAIAIGLIAAGAAAAVLESQGLPDWKAALGAICFGGLIGLAAADLIVEGAGDWWGNHEMFGTGVAGFLLLGLTVLVIDEVIARTTAARWRKAARSPVARLAATRNAMVLKQLGSAVGANGWETAPDTPAVVRSSTGLLDRTVISARALTPLLTASDDLLEVYASVSAVADEAERVSRYGAGYLEALETRGPRPANNDVELRFVEASLRFQDAHDGLVAALGELDTVARRVLGAGAADAHSPDSPFALVPRRPL
jgi:hypothetical protein